MGHLNGEVTVTEAGQILRETGSILLVDWPSKHMPETLVRAGYAVVVKGGPEPDNYWAYEVRDGEAVSRRTGEAPAAVDLVCSYRPVEGKRRVAPPSGGTMTPRNTETSRGPGGCRQSRRVAARLHQWPVTVTRSSGPRERRQHDSPATPGT
jgi:hypothetical protein